MKKFLLITLLVFILIAGVNGKDFEKGDKYLTGQIGLNTYAIPIGASFGLAITDNIEVGGTVMAYFWDGITVIQPSADAMYHFTSLELPVDLFAGASLGYLLAMGDGVTYSGGLSLTPMIGARYFFKDNLAVSLKVFFSVLGDMSGAGGLLGVTLVL
ncbi:MAG: hypothetical protein KAS97_03360 [Candidatus Aminicenantes bacterium]|nr:hypothetical protein [Candidatus Aminicenantes bacterium]